MNARALARYAPRAPSTSTDRRTALVREHGPLIDACARVIGRRTGVDPAELWSAGAVGLLEAVERFDAGRGASLQTFLGHRVRGAMLDEVRRMDRLPRRLRDDVSSVRRAADVLEARLGRAPSTREIASQAAMAEDAVVVALDAHAASAEGVPVDDAVAGESDVAGAESLSMLRQDSAAAAAAIAALPERTQLIVSLRFVEDLSQKEIAQVLQLSEARGCQILKGALAELRAALT